MSHLSKRVDLVKPGGFAAGTNLVTTSVSSVSIAQGSVLVDIRASAVNPVDWKMAEHGFFLAADGKPTSLGCEVSGTIVATPDNSSPWKIGQRVVTYLGADKTKFGTTRPAFADTTAVDSDLVFIVPEGMTLNEAASLPVGGLTAVLLLNALGVQDPKDSWVLIWGASSSVGYSAIPLAVQRGYKVLAVAGSKHANSLTKLGAAACVDYKSDRLSDQVKDILKQAPLNVAIDCIGTNDSFDGTAKLVSSFGAAERRTVSTVSGQTPEPPAGVVKVPVSLASIEDNKAMIVQSMPTILKYCKPLKLRVVTGSVSAETVEKAFALQKKGVSMEKVVIEWEKEVTA